VLTAKTILMFHLTIVGTLGAWAAEPLLVMENSHLSLRFDAGTGAWISLVDKVTDGDLVVAGLAPVSVAPAPPPVLDSAQVARAVAAGQALDLAGDWLYTATPPKTDMTADFLFDEVWLDGQRIGRTNSETPQAWKTPRMYQLAASQVHRDRPNVLLVKVTNGAFDGGIDGPVALGVASHLLVKPPVAPPLTQHDIVREGGATILRMTAPDGNYEYHAEFVLPDDRAAFTRRLSVTNRSATEQLFQSMFYVTPPLAVGADTAVIFPGSLPVGDTALLSLGDGVSMSPRSSEPLAVLWSQKQQRGLGAWFFCEEEYSPVSVRHVGIGGSVGHRQNVIMRLKSGETIALGLQCFWLTHGSRDAVLSGVQEAYRAVGLHVPVGALEGLRGMTLYCGHPGGPPELGYLRYGGFQALTEYVPTLQRMNIDLLWLLPTWDHGDGSRWNLYAPFDHFQVDRLLGTAIADIAAQCAENAMDQ
jgi:hypothetical protein